MVCCRALALQLLPASAPSRAAAASRARVSVRRRRVLYARCCAAAGADHGESPQDAVLKAISQIASSNGRVAQTTNVVMGDTVTDDATDEWLVLDKKVNTYPTVRGFTAIGTGGDDFVQSMVVAVESILLERIPEDLMFHAFWYSMQVQKDLLFEFHNPKLDGSNIPESVFKGEICFCQNRTYSCSFQQAGPSGVQCHEER